MEDSELQAAKARLKAAELKLSEAQARGTASGRTTKDLDSWRKAAVEQGRALVAYKEAQTEANLRERQAATSREKSQDSRGRIPGRL
jgi:hypothetical protein